MSIPQPVRYLSERADSPEGFGAVKVFAEFASGMRSQVPHVVWHSPTGLEYGYGGSGPADTALSILADWFEIEAVGFALKLKGPAIAWDDYTDDERRVVRLHQAFKFKHVGGTSREHPLIIYAREIERFLVENEIQESAT